MTDSVRGYISQRKGVFEVKRDYVQDNAGVTLPLVMYGTTLQKGWAEGVIKQKELDASPEDVIKVAHVVYQDMMQLVLTMIAENCSKKWWQFWK